MKRSTTTSVPLLTVAKTAENLNLSEKSVYRLIQARKLRVIRCGCALRIHPDDLRDYIDASRV